MVDFWPIYNGVTTLTKRRAFFLDLNHLMELITNHPRAVCLNNLADAFQGVLAMWPAHWQHVYIQLGLRCRV